MYAIVIERLGRRGSYRMTITCPGWEEMKEELERVLALQDQGRERLIRIDRV